MTALEPREAGAFLRELGPRLDAAYGRPRAVLAISAHTQARELVALTAARHHAMYDFGGFDPALYQLRYDAPGAPELADELRELLGPQLRVLNRAGLDHGIWTPMRYLYPDADLPILTLAWPSTASPHALFSLGQKLAPLREQGVLIMCSGSLTHNLHLVLKAQPPIDSEELPECQAFREWFAARSAARDWPALLEYRQSAPHASLMHPSDEHLLPWYVAAGAGGEEATPTRIHASLTYGCLAMDAYAFGSDAQQLA